MISLAALISFPFPDKHENVDFIHQKFAKIRLELLIEFSSLCIRDIKTVGYLQKNEVLSNFAEIKMIVYGTLKSWKDRSVSWSDWFPAAGN